MKKLLAISIIILILFCLAIQSNADGCGYIEIHGIGRYELTYGQSVNQHQHIACLYHQQGCIIVGNHYASASESGGLWKLENLHVGDKAYIEYVTADGMEEVHHTGNYVCYAIFLADVVGHEFAHKGQEVRPYEPTDLICTTCVGWDSTRNYVAFFEKVG